MLHSEATVSPVTSPHSDLVAEVPADGTRDPPAGSLLPGTGPSRPKSEVPGRYCGACCCGALCGHCCDGYCGYWGGYCGTCCGGGVCGHCCCGICCGGRLYTRPGHDSSWRIGGKITGGGAAGGGSTGAGAAGTSIGTGGGAAGAGAGGGAAGAGRSGGRADP